MSEFDFDMEFEVTGGEELWTPPAAPVKAVVRVERDEEGNHMIKPPKKYERGKNAGKYWIRVPFKVQGGDFDNYRATMFLTIDPEGPLKNPYFRKTFAVVTGINVEQLTNNMSMKLSDFIDQLVASPFEAVIQQQNDWDAATQSRVPTNFTEVARLIRKLDASELPASGGSMEMDFGADSPAPEATDVDGDTDDDMPF